MGRGLNKRKNWILTRFNDNEEIVETHIFRTQKEIAEYLEVKIGVVKVFTCKDDKRCKCKMMRKSTKERWGKIKIDRLIEVD